MLVDCMILTTGVMLVLGGGAYVFGHQLLGIYTSDAEVIQCGDGDPPVYDGNLFSVWTDGSVPRIHARNGIFSGANDYLCDRYGRISDCMDWMDIPGASFSGCTVYLPIRHLGF